MLEHSLQSVRSKWQTEIFVLVKNKFHEIFYTLDTKHAREQSIFHNREFQIN